MSFRDIVHRTWEGHQLFSALVELTYRCNLDCFFCYNDLGTRGRPLDKEQYYRFFEDLRDLEMLNLALSGGEPLAHPDFFDLGRKARELGFVVRVKSNGHALRGTIARRLREEVDPFMVEVSLHGSRPETHGWSNERRPVGPSVSCATWTRCGSSACGCSSTPP